MQSIQALREKRGSKAKEARNLLDPATNSFTNEVAAQVDAIYAEIELIDKQVALIEKSLLHDDGLNASVNEFQAQFGGSSDHAEHTIRAARKAVSRYVRLGYNSLSAEEKQFIKPAPQSAYEGKIVNVAEGTPSQGGYSVPTIIMPELLIKLKYYGGMRSVARMLSTSGGYPIQWATMDDTANSGYIVAENVAAGNLDLSFGQTTINAWK